jgi:glycosyltransferase involved in cell wall biosynthesis
MISDRKWQQRPLQVNMYGEGMHTRTIKKMIGYFGLNNVFVRGQQPTVDIWKENHALLLTSRFEGLPLALVEAMLCGRTSIVTAVSGTPEVVVDNENAFVAKYPSLEEIDKAMERAWQRREEWEHMGKLAKKHIQSIIPEDPIQVFYEKLLSFVNR